MPYTLPSGAVIAINQLEQDRAYLTLLEVTIPAAPDFVLRLAYNNEDVVWNGHVWQAFPFQLGEIPENVDELPSVDLKVSNINQLLEEYYEATDGGAGGIATVYVVRSDALDEPAMVEHEFDIKMSTIDDFWVTLKLGLDSVMNQRRPIHMFKANHCDHKATGVQCGAVIRCGDHTLGACRKIGNALRFFGFPTLKKG